MVRTTPKAAVTDGLSNVVTGLGTSADKNSYRGYVFMPLDPSQAESAYRTSWLTRKIVDVPPQDMTRNWREWQAEAAQIEAIEAEEKRLGLKSKILRALILARLYGGGALILGAPGLPNEPVNPAAVRKGGLAYIHVVSRHQLSYTSLDNDPASPMFGKPLTWRVSGSKGGVEIHPSRVVAIRGQLAPEGSVLTADPFWGDPIMQSVGDAVANADLAQAGFATLINEASLDIIGIEEMMSNLGSA
jgi:phage-related protein (TIGR01555 family)